MTTVHPSLAGGGEGGPVPWHPHGGDDLSGQATFLQLHVENLLAGTIDSKEIVISGGVDGVIRSDNFETGVSGWAIFGDGSAEFSDVTVRGVIEAGVGSDVPANIITSGTISAANIDVTGGANTLEITSDRYAQAQIRSGNFSSGSSGFRIRADGNAEFQDVTVRGVLTSLAGSSIDWTHVDNVSVATADIANAAITTAKIANAAITNAKIDSLSANKLTAGTISTGTINVASLLQMNSGGTFQTAPSGSRRVRMRSTVTDRIEFVNASNSIRARLILDASNDFTIETLGSDPLFVETGGALNLNVFSQNAVSVGGSLFVDGTLNSQTGLVADGNIRLGNHTLGSNGGFRAYIASDINAGALRVHRNGTSGSAGVFEVTSAISGGAGDGSVHLRIYQDGDVENTNNSYGALSDERLKKDIETARPYLDDLRRIRITKHTRRGSSQRNLGPIAQEVREVFPALVYEDEEGYLGVKHSVFVPMLITAVQELAADRDRLEERISRLEEKAAA